MSSGHQESLAAPTESAQLAKIGPVGTLLGLVGFVAFGLFYFMNAANQSIMIHAYTYGFMFWLTLALGCLGFTLLHHLVRGSWGLSILRIMEAGGSPRVFAGLGIGFIPILLNLNTIYPWTHPGTDKVLLTKAGMPAPFSYTPTMFTIRAVAFFALWAFLAYWFKASADRQDKSGDEKEVLSRNNFAGPAFIMFVLSVTWMATDFVMSMDAHWYSTMFGPIFVVSGALAALSMATFLVCNNRHKQPYASIISPDLTKDLGNLLFTCTLLWAYFNFSQFLIIWNGNLPATAKYYFERSPGGWNVIGGVLIACVFVIPFITLLAPATKRYPNRLAMIAAWIFILRVPDIYFVVAPMYRYDITPTWEILSFIAVGGLWLALFGSAIKGQELYPAHDRRLLEASHHA